MDFRKIRILSFSITLIISLILLIFNYTWCLGFLLGGASAMLGFEMISFTVYKSKPESLKANLISSRIIRMIMYGGVITLGILTPHFNVICMALSFFVVKMAIILLDKFKKGG